MAGLYVSGWLKRGPSGIIGSNISDAQATAATILHDWASAFLCHAPRDGGEGLGALLRERGVRVVDKEGWKRICSVERERAAERGLQQPRHKLTSIADMLHAASSP